MKTIENVADEHHMISLSANSLQVKCQTAFLA